jgi:replicative DNA helicase
MNIESVILSNLIYSDSFVEKTLPFLKTEYFQHYHNQIIFDQIIEHIEKYKRSPAKKELLLDLSRKDGLGEKVFKDIEEVLKDEISKDLVTDDEWSVNKAEEFCKERALFNALKKSIEISEDNSGKYNFGEIPKILEDALSVSFDNRVGYDYFDEAENRWESYHKLVKKMPFDIELLNKITDGGFETKSLNLLLAPSGVGKSLVMCHFAAAYLAMGYNVLYVTLEMSEEQISKRIDANLYNTDISELKKISKPEFLKKVEKFKTKTQGKLVVQEYPNNTAHAGHFRQLIIELQRKRGIKVDVLIVDYIGICASYRLKRGNTNSYEYGKAVCEEIRSIGQEFDIPTISAIQTNRSGYNVSDLDLTSVSESIGGPMSADLLLGVVQTEEFAELGQYLFIQLKNRYNDVNDPKRFIVGVDKAKMRLYDVEDSAQSSAYNPGKSYEEYDYKPIESSVNKDKFKGIT